MDAISLVAAIEQRSERLLGTSVAKALTERVYLNTFFAAREWRNLAYGVFSSFGDAEDFCKEHGVRPKYVLDHRWWATVQETLKVHDYPAIYWLTRFIGRGNAVLDVGGSVGVTYYTYSKLIDHADTLTWQVLELPEVAAQGRSLARERGCTALSFVDSWSDARPPDVVICAGAAQFLPRDLDVEIGALPQRPRCILINRTPVHADSPFVTLQNTGNSIAPCRVYRRDAFIRSFENLGYTLIDQWDCLQNHLTIPYRPELALDRFRGFFFVRQ